MNQAKHETASEFQSLLSKDWPSMDVKQDLESMSHRDVLLTPSLREAQRHHVASNAPVRIPQKKSRKLRRRTKKNRHEATTTPTPSISAAASSTISTTTTTSTATSSSPTTLTTLLLTISSSTTTTTTTTTTSSLPTISLESTTTTTTRPLQRNPPVLGRSRSSKRNRQNHAKQNLIKLRTQCFPGFINIGTSEVASKEFNKDKESEGKLCRQTEKDGNYFTSLSRL